MSLMALISRAECRKTQISSRKEHQSYGPQKSMMPKLQSLLPPHVVSTALTLTRRYSDRRPCVVTSPTGRAGIRRDTVTIEAVPPHKVLHLLPTGHEHPGEAPHRHQANQMCDSGRGSIVWNYIRGTSCRPHPGPKGTSASRLATTASSSPTRQRGQLAETEGVTRTGWRPAAQDDLGCCWCTLQSTSVPCA